MKVMTPTFKSAPESSQWLWPDSLDALIAAPAYHILIFENEHVRVVRTRIPSGDTVPLHTHRSSSTYVVLNWSEFVRRDHLGNVTLDTRLAPAPALNVPAWQEPLPPHTVENVGTDELHTIAVEIKSAAAL